MAFPLGLGTVLMMSTDGTTTYGQTIGQLRGISGPNSEADDIETSTLDSTTFRTFTPSLINPGELSLDIAYDFANAVQKGLASQFKSRDETKFKVIFPTTTVSEEFAGYIKSIGREIPRDDLMTRTVVIKISGDPGFQTTT